MEQRNKRKSIWRFVFLLLISFVLYPWQSFAVPAFDGLIVLKQPDGRSFEARQRGDEWNNWVETRQGYGIYRNDETGEWEYYLPSPEKGRGTRASQGQAKALVGRDDPAAKGIPKGLRPQRKTKKQISGPAIVPSGSPSLDGASSPSLDGASSASGGVFLGAPAFGVRPLLVIAVDFSDAPGIAQPSEIRERVFGTTNSVADYYARTSYSAVTVVPASESSGAPSDGVVGWLRLSGNHPNTGSGFGPANQQLAKDAVLAADPYIDYAAYDANSDGIVDASELSILVIVSGYDAGFGPYTPSIWGHTSDMFNVGNPVVDGKTISPYAEIGERHVDHLATIGIMVHELGHLTYGLPDLYAMSGASAGIGFFDLMSSGCWADAPAPGSYPGSLPTQLSAWSKEYLSWGTVTTLTSGSPVSFPNADGNPASIFRIDTTDPNQYFLIENRQFTGYDQGFLGPAGASGHGGLAIYHIDKARGTNNDPTSKKVDVEEANEGLIAYSMLDNDDSPAQTKMFFFSGNNTDFTGKTTPNSALKNGTPSAVAITDISGFGDTMSASICTESISYALSPSFASHPAVGGAGLANLTASSAGCAWKARSTDPWISITSGGAGSGSGTIAYSVSRNAGTGPRIGTIVIAGEIFTVAQNGDPNGTDTTPDPFLFQDMVDVLPDTPVYSNSITVSGIAAPAPISIIGGEYEINHNGSWTVYGGLVNNGDTVRVRVRASAAYGTTKSVVLTIGGVSDTFSATTTFRMTLLSENFDIPAPVPPFGWTVIDNIGLNAVWLFHNPGNRDNMTGGANFMAIADSNFLYGFPMDTELRTPVLDMSSLTEVSLKFRNDYVSVSHTDIADVDVSTNGEMGPWFNVFQMWGSDFPGPFQQEVDLTPYVAGRPSVMLRFHYTNAYPCIEMWWQVDDVVIEGLLNDTVPDQFQFADQTGAQTHVPVVSNSITVTGISMPIPVSITGGEYEINGSGIWSSAGGMVANGDTVRVRQTSSSSYGTRTDTILTIEEVSDTFSVTTIEKIPVTAVALVADKPGPGILSTIGAVTFTATASGGTGTCEYKFLIWNETVSNSFVKIQDYGEENTLVWNPATVGNYFIAVMARNVNSVLTSEAVKILPFGIIDIAPAASVNLVADKPGPGILSTIGAVTFTATASGGTGPYEYKFLIRNATVSSTYAVIQEYSPLNILNWLPEVQGTYTIKVMARKVNSVLSYEAVKTLAYDVAENTPVASVNLVADKPGPGILFDNRRGHVYRDSFRRHRRVRIQVPDQECNRKQHVRHGTGLWGRKYVRLEPCNRGELFYQGDGAECGQPPRVRSIEDAQLSRPGERADNSGNADRG